MASAKARKPRVAVHKFGSCDGCQLAFLNLGEPLLALAEQVDLVHFAEAGPLAPDALVEIAFIEGSLMTPEDLDRIRRIRQNTQYLVTIGACATAGGLQALRNLATDGDHWAGRVYPRAHEIALLDSVRPIRSEVAVDLELWGCPVNSRQILAAIRSLLLGAPPVPARDSLCLECKRQHVVCVMVTKGLPCMGPVTQTGCGALCPAFGRDCYGCYGPAEAASTATLTRRLEGLGLLPEAVARRFHQINSGASPFTEAGTAGRRRAESVLQGDQTMIYRSDAP